MRSLAFSPDGKWLASGEDRGNQVRVWERRSGKLVACLKCDQEERGFGAEPQFLPDGKHLAVVGHDGVGIWNVRSWQWERVFRPPPVAILGERRIHPNGRHVVQFYSTKLNVWDLNAGSWLRDIPLTAAVEASEYSAWAFAPAAPLMACGSPEGVRILDLESGREAHRFGYPSKGKITAMAFSSDGVRVAVGDLDGSIRIFDLSRKRQQECDGRTVLNGPEEQDRYEYERPIKSLAFLQKDTLLASGCAGKQVRLWDLQAMQRFRQAGRGGQFDLGATAASVIPLAGSLVMWEGPYSTVLASTETWRTWRLPDSGDSSYPHHTALAASPDGSAFAWGNEFGRLGVCSAQDASPEIPRSAADPWWQVGFLSIGPDGRLWASGWHSISIRDVTRAPGRQEVLSINGCWGGPAVLDDGCSVLVPRGRGVFEVWDADSGSLKRSITVDGKPFSNWYTASGSLLAREQSDDTHTKHVLAVFSLDTGKRVGTYDLGGSYLRAVAISACGERLAFSTDEKTWVAAPAKDLLVELAGKNARGSRGPLAVSDDGKWVCSAGTGDGWNLYAAENGEAVCEAAGGRLQAAHFSPSGSLLITQDGTGRMVVRTVPGGNVRWEAMLPVRMHRLSVLEERIGALLVLTQNLDGTCYLLAIPIPSPAKSP